MLFDTILQKLRREVQENDYNRYIKQIVFNAKDSRSDLIILELPNPLVANWVKSRFATTLAHLYEQETGIRPQIVVGVKNRSSTTSSTTLHTSMPTKTTKSTLLNPAFTFDSFVSGSSNKLAFNAALSVAFKSTGTYNPFFIYGGVGLGKTHLLHAIGNAFIAKNAQVIYATSEHFLNDFTYHLRNKTIDRFTEKYRGCDLLLIDDVQFFSNKTETQEAFFHTFNELIAQNKQIVLSADKHPKQIIGLEERLKSRFEAGLIADIQPPELETKIAIINKKCEIDGIRLDSDVVEYIATTMNENIREIEGIIIKLNAYSKMIGQEITMEFTKSALKEHIKESRQHISIETIVETVARELGLKPSEIRSKLRSTNIVNARRMVIALARNLTPNSMPMIASFFGMKDHTAVSHAFKKMNEQIESDPSLGLRLKEMENKIRLSSEKV